MATYGHGLSGGDRIWIEISKILSQKNTVNVYLWEEGLEIAKREGLFNVNYVLWSAENSARLGFIVNYFARILIALWQVSHIKLVNSPKTIIYSASEFWQDSLPAVILKLRYPKIIWVAAWYQTAPNPLKGFTEGDRQDRYRFKAFLYWLVQQPIKPIINKFADIVVVNNENEKRVFPEHGRKNQLLIMLGAVNVDKIEKYKNKYKKEKKIFDGVFQGRFHPQKGVLELVDIWKLVVNKKPNAKLAMIGDGSLMQSVKSKIKSQKLEKNIELFGYLFDGETKYRIFSQSKLVLHPAFYDSGGMASAEAMAFGLPAVTFNLEAYSSYYPYGIVKVKIGDLSSFSNEVLNLLQNQKIRHNLGLEALRMIKKNWSWKNRVDSLLKFIDKAV